MRARGLGYCTLVMDVPFAADGGYLVIDQVIPCRKTGLFWNELGICSTKILESWYENFLKI